MKTLLTPTPLIAFEIEEESHRIQPESDFIDYFIDIEEREYRYIDIGFEFDYLGSVDKGVIDFDCDPYVESWKIPQVCKAYRSYTGKVEFHTEKEKSFLSLLQKHSLSLDKKYLIIKPKN